MGVLASFAEMAKIIEYAQMCDAVYSEDPQVDGWSRVAFKPSGSGWSDAFQGAAFRKGGEVVFACKGTSQKRDVLADLKLGVGMNSSQFSKAEKFIKQTGSCGAQTITVTGHSLGGAIAQIAGHRNKLRFVTFNAPGVALYSRNVDQMAASLGVGLAIRTAGTILSAVRHPMQAARDLKGAFRKANGVNIRLGKDVVGCIGVHMGKVVEIPYGGGAMDVKTKHKIGSVIAALGENATGQRSLDDML